MMLLTPQLMVLLFPLSTCPRRTGVNTSIFQGGVSVVCASAYISDPMTGSGFT